MEQKQCRGCRYWRRLSSSGVAGMRVCHYLLLEGKPRQRDEKGACRSFKKIFFKTP
ncbi:MAG: hypothetical protein K2P04_10535 [Oscillospiraceae bacterium]|nr:hypothetical protein [Oscillospiraceae bacterium]